MSYTKDPDAVLDYAWDWSAWLATGETITAAVVTVPTGITLNSSPHTTTTVTAWLAGGTIGEVYPILCHITTNQGRIDDRTQIIRIRQR